MADHETQQITDIAPNGDVIFAAGPSATQFRVDSGLLKSASPVFKAMFGPDSSEGRQLRETGRTQVADLYVDAAAMEIVFNAIHGRNNRVPESLASDNLLQVAVCTYKYECFTSLSFATQRWLRQVDLDNTTDSWIMAMAALLLGDGDMFSLATAALMFNCGDPYKELIRRHAGPLLRLTRPFEKGSIMTVLKAIAGMFSSVP